MAPRRTARSLPTAPARTASAYVRLSREAAAENLSRDGMVADCRAQAEREGLSVIAVHVDDGISGAVRNRPEFVAWLADAQELRADHLLTWSVDRLTREGVNVAAAILDTIEGKDAETGRVVRPSVRLLDTKGLDSAGDDTAFRFSFVIAAEVARAERERMRDRARAARRRAASAGRWSGGLPPFGFQVIDNPDGPGRVLAVDEAEAAAIRQAADRVLSGERLISVVRWLNGPEGAKPRRAKEWQQTTLRQTLTGGPVSGHLGDGGRCPEILDPDTAAAVRAALAVKAPAQRGGRQPARLLSGLVTCWSCGTVLQVARRTTKAPNGTGVAAYRCPNPRLSGTCSAPVSISAEALDDYVSGVFLDAFGDSPELVRRVHVTGAAELEAAEKAAEAALADLGQGVTPERIQALQEAQARREAALLVPQQTTTEVVPSGRTVRAAWEATDVHGRRDLIARNYAAMIVKPGRRGRPGIQPERVDLIGQPPYVSGVSEDWAAGRVAVAVED
jgi:site-specific DNA recombinase